METINKTDNTAGNSPIEINMQALNFLKTTSKYVILSLIVAGPAYADDSINKNPNWTYIPYVPKGGEAAKPAPETGEKKTKPAETSKTTPPVPVKPQSAAPQGGDAAAQETAPESAAKPADTSKSTQAVPVTPQPGPSQGGASEATQTAPEAGAKPADTAKVPAPGQPESKTGPKSTSEASTKKDTETKKSGSAEVVKPQGKESAVTEAVSEGSGKRDPDKSYAGKDTGQTKSQGAGAVTGNAAQSQEELPFEVADKNGDHFVSKEELKDYPHLLEVFDKVDAGKDGKLEQHEYANLVSEKKREGFQP